MKNASLLIFLAVMSACVGQAIGKTAPNRNINKHRFYLLSAYTPDKTKINKHKFVVTYEKISKRGIVVYKNGQTYSILVPIKQVYLKGTANYAVGGEQTLKDLADFLAFYDTDYMSFTGIGFKVEDDNEQPVDSDKGSFKGDYRGYKKIKSDLKYKNRKITPRLISLKQASKMVYEMKKMNNDITNIGVSISDEVDKNQAYIDGVAQEANKRMSLAKSRLEIASMLLQEVIDGKLDMGIYDDGAVLIEYKKY